MDPYSSIHSVNYNPITPDNCLIQKDKTASSKKKIIYSLIFFVGLLVFGLIFIYCIKQSMKLEMNSNTTFFRIPNVTERPQENKMLQRNKNDFEFDTVDAYLDLGMVDNDILFFSPPRRFCFIISRTGKYNLYLFIKRNSSCRPQNVSVIFKNQTLENPTVIINEILSFEEHKSSTFRNATFLAKERDQVWLISDHCLDEDDYILIQML